MRYQVSNSKETNSVELKNTVDGIVEKTKLSIYEDGSDETCLKMIKEFQNYVNTYNIRDEENAARAFYHNFRRCLAGAARDLWDQINELEDEEEVRDELSFDDHLQELTSAILGEDALRNQKDYLKTTPKPDKMSVKQWINRIKNINSYLPLMQPNGRSFTEEDLIAEVISKNIPAAWKNFFKMFKLHLETKIKDIISELTVIEEQVKTHPKSNQNLSHKKQLKTPCRFHNGNHQWDDCRQNPKNQKNDDKTRNNGDNNHGRNNANNNPNREENRRTESDRSRHHSRSSSGRSSGGSHEYHNITEQEGKNQKKVPSSEILITIPAKKGSKKYTAYLGLVDSGASASLVNKELVEMSDFNIKVQKKPTKWDTANGVFNTDGTVIIENFNLPQFTRKRAITASFHMYHKKPTDKYNVILGRTLLKDIGFDIHYSASQFVWDNAIIDMVPSGHWTKEKIKSIAKSWNTKRVLNREGKSDETNDESNEELCLATILPANYKPVDIASVVEKQTHLTVEEREKLHTMLLDFQTPFQGKRGNYNGEPIELELLPDAKPFYRKPFFNSQSISATHKRLNSKIRIHWATYQSDFL
jgi:hypothetical protein